MRVAVTGSGGLLGTTLVPLWQEAGAELTAWTRQGLDVTGRMAVRTAIREARPEVVVHAAAWTNVDGAESDEPGVLRVNRDGTAAVMQACADVGALLVYLSTDYVFDGTARSPILPGTPVRPLSAYGRSKAAGEAVVRAGAAEWLIVRTGWVYGPGGRNFVDTMRQAAAERREVSVVDDQVGAPTSARLLAEALWALVSDGARGLWHVAPAGETSWHGVARSVYEAAGAGAALVRSCSSIEAARPAPRPAYAVLDCRETAGRLGTPLPPWDEQVRAYVRTGKLPDCGYLRATA